MNWLDLDKYLWRGIFQILSNSPTHRSWDVCTLRAVCRFMRDVSSIRMNGYRWVFRQNCRFSTRVRYFLHAPIRDWQRPKKQGNAEWTSYIKNRQPVFSKTKSTCQPLESVSWCKPNKRTKEKGRRSHHQKKHRERGDFRRSGAMDESFELGGYITYFANPSELGERQAWTEIEIVIKEDKDVFGAVKGKYISERQWKDKITGVVYYRQKYYGY